MSKKKKSPSRLKYETENPTVSARVPKKTRDSLYANLAKLDMSLTDALKVLAGELKVNAKPIGKAWQAGFAAGKGSGYKEAKERYEVPYNCSGCGKEIVVTSEQEKRAIKRYMREHGWGHNECVERMRRLRLGL
jgi:hypothetical protein